MCRPGPGGRAKPPRWRTVPAVLAGTPMTRDELAIAVAERAGRPQLAERLRSGWGAVLKPMRRAGSSRPTS